jgi:hypothetical protein
VITAKANRSPPGLQPPAEEMNCRLLKWGSMAVWLTLSITSPVSALAM